MYNKELEKRSIEIYYLKKENKETDDQNNELNAKINLFGKEKLGLLEHRQKIVKLCDLELIDSAVDPIISDPKDYTEIERKKRAKQFYLIH